MNKVEELSRVALTSQKAHFSNIRNPNNRIDQIKKAVRDINEAYLLAEQVVRQMLPSAPG
jgi:hypothetical protein